MNHSLVRWLAATFILLAPPLESSSQTVSITFTGQVSLVVGSPVLGIAVGDPFSGGVVVDLAQIPPDSDSLSSRAGHIYEYSPVPGGYDLFFTVYPPGGIRSTELFRSEESLPAYGFPGIYLNQVSPTAHVLSFQARRVGHPYAVILSFPDEHNPATLLRGDYFPEDVNFPAGLVGAQLHYILGTAPGEFIAHITDASFTLDPGPYPASLARYRLRVSNLPSRLKDRLIARVNRSIAASASGHCKLANRRLKAFQRQVRAHVQKRDARLALLLFARAQSVLDAGCPVAPPQSR